MFSNDNSGLVGGIGLLVTSLGFLVTLWAMRVTYLQLIRTKTAAEAVQDVTEKIRMRGLYFDATIEHLKASKSLETTVAHLKTRSWHFASQSLWDAQISLNRILPDIKEDLEKAQTEHALKGFSENVRLLEEASDKGIPFEAAILMDLIRGQLIQVDKRIALLQRNIYDN